MKGTLRVPDDYTPPSLEADPDGDSGAIKFDYETLWADFSFNNGTNPNTGWCKVGAMFVFKNENGDFEWPPVGDRSLRQTHAHMVYHYQSKGKECEGLFIEKWLKDPRMDPKFLPAHEKHKRYFWRKFGMYPGGLDKDGKRCPDDVYNLWSGFAAEGLSDE